MLLSIPAISHAYVLYTYNGGALWWAIYRVPVVQLHDSYDWLFIYTVYTMADVCAYICYVGQWPVYF